MRTLLPGVGLVLAAALLPASTATALTLPPGFQARTLPLPKATSPSYENGLQKPTTLDFAPDGKLFVAERNGRVLEFDSIEDSTPTLVLSILDKVMAKGDRGILGMKLDPEYPSKPFIYLSYTYDAPIGGNYEDSTHTHYADGADDCVETKETDDCLVSGRLARVEINPATSVAVGGPVDPSSEQVLINSWCQQVTSHSIGDIEFDSEGALLMSGGDGASWGSIDFGQLGNFCNDPEYEGGSLRAQDLRTPATPGDPTDYNGSIIRVDRETGAALPNNPLSLAPLLGGGIEDTAAKRILAEGLRNPYRFTIQPGTGEIYIGDVGQDLWEEVDHFSPPPATGVGLTNFGWPCYEGGNAGNLKMPRWQAAEGETHKPLCEVLYTNPAKVTAPLFAYPHANAPGHDGLLFEGDACDPTPGSAISGMVFYDPTGVPAEATLPAEYDGALFFADAARGCVWTMLQGLNGVPDPATVANFALPGEGDVFTPVDIVEGADGALYVPNFYGDSIVEIRYIPGNQAPEADLSASTTYGSVPLEVNFDASGSTDPDLSDGDNLHYAWDLDGDGEFDDGSGVTASYEYTEAKNVTAKLRVTDDLNHVSVAETTLYPGDLGPPDVEIKAPTPSFEWEVGGEVPYEAVATDPDGDEFGSIPKPLTAHWEFTLEHCPVGCHEHPITSADEPSGSFVAPPHEPPVHLKLEFTAIDSRGMSSTEVVEIFPREVEVVVASDPIGVPLGVNGVSAAAPFASTVIAGGTATVAAPATASIGGAPYVFDSWSDGGAPVHDADTSEDVELVATYLPEPEEPGGGGGTDTPPPVLSPPPVNSSPPSARIKLASRPPGAKISLGAVRKGAPFAAEVPLGTQTFLAAPRTFHKGGRTYRFSRWTSGGRKLGTAPRRALTVSGAAAYLALYVVAAQRPHGGR